MRHGHVGKAVEGRVEQNSLGMALHHAKNGESPQKVQSKDSFPINIDAPKFFMDFGWLLQQHVPYATVQTPFALAKIGIKVQQSLCLHGIFRGDAT